MINLPRKKENTRIITFNKLINVGKSSEKDILNLRIEDLKDITEDVDIQNIIYLRDCIKNHDTIKYFNFQFNRGTFDCFRFKWYLFSGC